MILLLALAAVCESAKARATRPIYRWQLWKLCADPTSNTVDKVADDAGMLR